MQTDVAASADTYIDDSATTTNYGSSTQIKLGAQFGFPNILWHSLQRFDLSAVTGRVFDVDLEADITSAASAITFGFYRLTTTDWTEAGVTWSKKNGVDNWAGGAAFTAADYTTVDGKSQSGPSATGVQDIVSNASPKILQGQVGGNFDVALVRLSGTGQCNARTDEDSNQPMTLKVHWVPASDLAQASGAGITRLVGAGLA